MWKQSNEDTKNGKKEVSLPEAAVMGSTAMGCKLLLSSGRRPQYGRTRFIDVFLYLLCSSQAACK